MTCYCGEPADTVCADCGQPFCDSHLWIDGLDGVRKCVCNGCLDGELTNDHAA